MKERNRYLTLRFISPKKISEKEAWFTISSSVKKMYGSYGASTIGLFLSYFEEDNQVGIFRVSHNSTYLLAAALCFINTRNNQSIYIYSENTSGTIKKARTLLSKEKYNKRAKIIRNLLFNHLNANLDDDKLHT